VQVKQAITIRRPVEEVYAFWRDFQNLPRFMPHLESVQVIGPGRSHWKTQAPGGTCVEWDAETVEDRANELIAWRSLDGADVPNAGLVQFRLAPRNQGTEIEVDIQYDPPGGEIGQTIAKLFGKEPGQQVAADLRRLKQVLETGEILISDATIRHAGLAQRPAQPPERAPRYARAAR
jgi:uncharacterized membrane protein